MQHGIMSTSTFASQQRVLDLQSAVAMLQAKATVMEGQAKGVKGSARAESSESQSAPPTVNHAPRRRRFSVDLSSWGRKIGQLPPADPSAWMHEAGHITEMATSKPLDCLSYQMLAARMTRTQPGIQST